MAGPDPAVARGRRALRELGSRRAILACSGGQDSLALAACAVFVAPRDGWDVRVIVVDHQLRETSGAEAAAAAAMVRSLGLPVDVIAITVPGGSGGTGHGGPEAAARTARRAALLAAAERHEADAILLGHTLDDQAETVLLALARGSGAASLSGMRRRDGLWARPFLGLRRDETRAICEAHALRPIEDPSNDLEGPWRAADGSALRRIALRHRVLPALTEILGPAVPLALARTADQLARDDDALSELARDLADAAKVACEGAAGTCFDLAALRAAHPAIRTRLIHRALAAAAGEGVQIGSVHVGEVDRLVTTGGVHGPIFTPGGVIAQKVNGMLMVASPQGDIRGR